MSGKSEKVQRIGGQVFLIKMRWCSKSVVAMITHLVLVSSIMHLVLVSSIMGLAGAVSRGGLQSEDSAPPNKVQKCREGCLDKVRGV